MLQATQQGQWRQQLDAGCRQFDGQRQPLQTGADRRHGVRISCGQLKIGLDGSSSLQEKRHGRHLRQVLACRKLWEIGDGQGGHGEFVFSRQMQGSAAGDQYVQVGAGSKQDGECCRGSDHLLEVVQQQEQVAVTQSRLQLLKQGTIKSFPQSERLGNGRDD